VKQTDFNDLTACYVFALTAHCTGYKGVRCSEHKSLQGSYSGVSGPTHICSVHVEYTIVAELNAYTHIHLDCDNKIVHLAICVAWLVCTCAL
jgi:hypothetical protein